MTVTQFPIYNLFNIPEALRKLANEIEADPTLAYRIVVIMDGESVGYRAFGKDFPQAYAVGLCEYGKAKIMGLDE